jgi:hypothetical protein
MFPVAGAPGPGGGGNVFIGAGGGTQQVIIRQ